MCNHRENQSDENDFERINEKVSDINFPRGISCQSPDGEQLKIFLNEFHFFYEITIVVNVMRVVLRVEKPKCA